eukprot:CAMPEP_0168593788 /NCGR_PEP_ID=MMETSP0420-20121227/8521_1 /TAXON_ID=498008 /ORGANISM="Pessonella sp." /LENGTH=240 /DNA_ID=CAMNT_0008630003 /DNA_START=843 /DNA_END=1562 /DNA_ORIENTATION=-
MTFRETISLPIITSPNTSSKLNFVGLSLEIWIAIGLGVLLLILLPICIYYMIQARKQSKPVAKAIAVENAAYSAIHAQRQLLEMNEQIRHEEGLDNPTFDYNDVDTVPQPPLKYINLPPEPTASTTDLNDNTMYDVVDEDEADKKSRKYVGLGPETMEFDDFDDDDDDDDVHTRQYVGLAPEDNGGIQYSAVPTNDQPTPVIVYEGLPSQPKDRAHTTVARTYHDAVPVRPLAATFSGGH